MRKRILRIMQAILLAGVVAGTCYGIFGFWKQHSLQSDAKGTRYRVSCSGILTDCRAEKLPPKVNYQEVACQTVLSVLAIGLAVGGVVYSVRERVKRLQPPPLS